MREVQYNKSEPVIEQRERRKLTDTQLFFKEFWECLSAMLVLLVIPAPIVVAVWQKNILYVLLYVIIIPLMAGYGAVSKRRKNHGK